MTDDTTGEGPATGDNNVAGDAEAAARLLDKLRTFVAEQLDEDERALLAVLLAPGVAMAYPDDEVVGFSVDWSANALPEALAVKFREGGLRVEGL